MLKSFITAGCLRSLHRTRHISCTCCQYPGFFQYLVLGPLQSGSCGANTGAYLVYEQGLCNCTYIAGPHLDAGYWQSWHAVVQSWRSTRNFLSDRVSSIIPPTFLLATRPRPLVILSFAGGSAFFNLCFGVVSRLYPLLYLTIKSVQNTGFSAYPAISSRDWTLHSCLPTPKDNFLSHFHCFKERICFNFKKRNCVNRLSEQVSHNTAQPLKTLEKNSPCFYCYELAIWKKTKRLMKTEGEEERIRIILFLYVSWFNLSQ